MVVSLLIIIYVIVCLGLAHGALLIADDYFINRIISHAINNSIAYIINNAINT